MPDQMLVSLDVDNGCMSYSNVSKFLHDRENGFASNMSKQEAGVSEQESRQLGSRFYRRREILNPAAAAEAGDHPFQENLHARRQHCP